MSKKPFFNLMRYRVPRKKWNPMRLIFGDKYLTGDIKKWTASLNLDPSGIRFIKIDRAVSEVSTESSARIINPFQNGKNS